MYRCAIRCNAISTTRAFATLIVWAYTVLKVFSAFRVLDVTGSAAMQGNCRTEVSMEETVYSTEWLPPQTLDYGWHKGRRYWVISYGHHPCCYIEMLKRDAYYGVTETPDIHLRVHGGVNYSQPTLQLAANEEVHGWFLGWDYSHFGDYTGTDFLVTTSARYMGFADKLLKKHKWTTQELRDACIRAIDMVDPRIWK